MTALAPSTLLRRAPATSSRGLPLFERGFRPFFACASLFATVAVPAWLLALHGGFQPGGAFGAMQWHAHQMLFGFTAAVIAGFVLTAAGNWTGRPTANGARLALLASVWVVGRVAVFFAAWAPGVAAVVDCAFLPLLTLSCAAPLFAARNRRNYVFVALLTALTVLNAGSHAAALHSEFQLVRDLHRLALDVVLFAMVLVTGRVVPAFTRNATGLSWIAGKPALERAALAAVVMLGAVDLLAVARPGAAPSPFVGGTLSAVAAALLTARMVGWGSWHARSEPLLWILHAGSAWLPVGLALRALSLVIPSIPASAALHALTAGAVGSLTLGMMARVSLGHTGRVLTASRPVRVAFICVALAGVLRVLAAVLPSGSYLLALNAAGAAWSAAFGSFFLTHARLLAAPRVDGR